MPVEIIGLINHVEQSEILPTAKTGIDLDWMRRTTRAHEEADFDRALVALLSFWPDPMMITSYCAAHSERLQFLIAHRPGFVAPTVTSRTLATLDHMTQGRIAMHAISGASDVEQRKDGDYLNKEERYARTGEYLEVLKRTWSTTEPVSYDGDFYRFEDYVPGLPTYQQPRIPLYFGGSSPAAYAVGAEHADVYMLFAQPLAETAEEIAIIKAAEKAAGRTTPLRFSVSFRPILGATEEEAWERAYSILDRINPNYKASATSVASGGGQRQLDAAAKGDRHDRALWTATAKATGAYGNTTSLVGTPETVAEALLDYVDIGVSTILIRGFEPYDDTVQYGKELIPRVRAGVAERERRQSAAASLN